MKNYVLIYDQGLEQDERDRFLSKLERQPTKIIGFTEFDIASFGPDDNLMVWVGDAQAAEVLDAYQEDSPALVFLPHPELKALAVSLKIPTSKVDAVNAFYQRENPHPVDFMSVDGQICLNSVVVADSLSVLFGSFEPGFFRQVKQRLTRFLRLFKNVKLRVYNVTFGKDSEAKSLEFAAMGMVAVAHPQNNLLFERLVKHGGVSDEQMHVIIFSPKSLFSIIRLGMQILFFPTKGALFPDFVAYKASDYVRIDSREPFTLSVDGEERTEERVELAVVPKKIKIYTSFELNPEESKKSSEIQLNLLPTGRLSEELTRKYLPWFRHATTEEFKDLFNILKQNAQVTSNFLVLMALSTLIATFGLFGDSAPVVIGAMILAPLMNPIISLAMGALRQDEFLIKNSMITIFWGVLLGLFFAILITWVTPLQTPNSEINARIRPNLLDLGIAIASGIAGAFAYSKEEISKTLAGVAISVALVPPLAVAGIGIGWGEWNVFWGAFLLLGTNLAGIVMAAVLTFLALGFSPFRLAKKGLFVSLLILLAIAAPLFVTFQKMVDENRVIQKLSGKEIPHGLLREVKVIELEPLRLSVTILSEKHINDEEVSQIKAEIEQVLGRSIYLELQMGIQIPAN